jgi:hypothetical protein
VSAHPPPTVDDPRCPVVMAAALAATSAFYAANGFTALGVRMRRGLG